MNKVLTLCAFFVKNVMKFLRELYLALTEGQGTGP